MKPKNYLNRDVLRSNCALKSQPMLLFFSLFNVIISFKIATI